MGIYSIYTLENGKSESIGKAGLLHLPCTVSVTWVGDSPCEGQLALHKPQQQVQ